jgi:hypothetical protein
MMFDPETWVTVRPQDRAQDDFNGREVESTLRQAQGAFNTKSLFSEGRVANRPYGFRLIEW